MSKRSQVGRERKKEAKKVTMGQDGSRACGPKKLAFKTNME